jgi:hypothetical protein
VAERRPQVQSASRAVVPASLACRSAGLRGTRSMTGKRRNVSQPRPNLTPPNPRGEAFLAARARSGPTRASEPTRSDSRSCHHLGHSTSTSADVGLRPRVGVSPLCAAGPKVIRDRTARRQRSPRPGQFQSGRGCRSSALSPSRSATAVHNSGRKPKVGGRDRICWQPTAQGLRIPWSSQIVSLSGPGHPRPARELPWTSS